MGHELLQGGQVSSVTRISATLSLHQGSKKLTMPILFLSIHVMIYDISHISTHMVFQPVQENHWSLRSEEACLGLRCLRDCSKVTGPSHMVVIAAVPKDAGSTGWHRGQHGVETIFRWVVRRWL